MLDFKINRKEIASVESLCLRESGMRVTTEYEILQKNGQAEVSLYFIRYESGAGKDERQLQKRVTLPLNEDLDRLNEYHVIKWNGFNGPNPPGLLDGTMFRFEAVLNSGEKIYASGSNNFPKHYRELRDWFYTVLQ